MHGRPLLDLHRACSLCDLGWRNLAAHVMHRRIGQRHAMVRSSHRCPPFVDRAPSPRKSRRTTPLRTAGSESWCSMPRRDGHLIRSRSGVGIQPKLGGTATTGERRMSAINRATPPAVCCWVADHHAVARHYPADGGHAVMQSQTTAYPASWVDLGAASRPLGDIAHGQRQRAGTHSAKARLCQMQSRPHRCHAAGPSSTVVRVGVGSQAGMSRRAALQRCGQGEVRSAVRSQLANAALSYGRTTYSHGSGAALPTRQEAAYSHGWDAALPTRREAAYSHQERAALPAQQEAAYSHGWDAALPALREATYSHPKAFEAWTVQACRSLGATMATPTRGMAALLQ